MIDVSKETFIRTWGEAGYRENWEVYGKMSGHTEEQVVATCLAPFYVPNGVALEIGCGGGFWADRYLAENFRSVIALDVIPRPSFQHGNVTYLEVPDRNFDCWCVADCAVDFVWSFGVFCHLSLGAVQRYLRGAFRVCRSGARVSLYFSDTKRRPGTASESTSTSADVVPWVDCDFDRAAEMVRAAGFVDVVDLLPTLPDAMVGARKP